jgi:AcrR family transcriptional regulator
MVRRSAQRPEGRGLTLDSTHELGQSRQDALEKPRATRPATRRFLQNRTTVRFSIAPSTSAVSDLAPPPSKPAREDASPPKAMQKGQQTRAAILDAALALASHMGLEGLSIGALAEVTRMSKSGVFAHFGSREELQISVIREYHARFEEEVFFPAINEPRGLPRLRAMFDRWVRRVSVEVDSGCIYISGAVEFDDRPGPVRDALLSMVQAWHDALGRALRIAIDEKHLRADTDPQQMLFELHGLILALHHDARFLRIPGAVERARTGFERIVGHYATPGSAKRR